MRMGKIEELLGLDIVEDKQNVESQVFGSKVFDDNVQFIK